MFQIVTDPIDTVELEKTAAPEVGAVSVFAGRVRNLNQGREVVSLEYECYESLAVKEGEKILEECRKHFPVLDLRCQHRVGHLSLGEIAIVVVAFSPHRRDAIRACSWVVDEVKSRVPIWKKEYYREGEAEWIYCPQCEGAGDKRGIGESRTGGDGEEGIFFSSQRNIQSIGEPGMEKLKRARVAVVGVGGLGSAVLENLVRMGIGRLVLIDFDRVSISNLARQTLYTTEDVGELKTVIAASRLKKINPWVDIHPIDRRLDESNLSVCLTDVDLVVDCTDNFLAKFLIHDHCFQQGIDLVQASVFQFEGRISNFFFSEQNSPCLRCLYPEIPSDACGGCAETGILATTVSLFGTLQANEVLKRVLGKPGIPQGKVMIWDLEDMESHLLQWKKDPACPRCGGNEIPGTVPEVDRVGMGDIVIATPDVDTDLFPIRMRLGEDYRKMDWEKLIDPEKRYVLVCRKGLRSHEIARYLSRLGYSNVSSLKQGVENYQLDLSS